MKTLKIFEAVQNSKGAPVNPFADTGSSLQQVEIKNERDKKLVQEEGAETKSEIQLEEKAKGNGIYGNIDLNNL